VVVECAVDFTTTIADIADRHLHKIVDLEQDLIAFGTDRAVAVMAATELFALVRTIHAEAARIPPPVLDAWLEAGPRAAYRDVAGHLQRIADRGLLSFEDAGRAENHFTLLTFANVAERSFWGAIPLAQEEITQIVTSGVHTYLRLYGTRSTG
jgi:hypothetical protein